MAVTLLIGIAQNSQNTANNTSNVTVTVRATWTYGSYNKYAQPGVLTIDGKNYAFTSSFNTGQSTSGSVTLFTKTVDVSHNSDGTKTLACSATYDTGVSVGDITASASKVLTTIARASSLSVSSSSVDMGSAVTISISRKSSSFTHSLAYSFAGGDYVSIATGVGTSYSWTTPDLATSIPNATSGTATIRCITYSGSTKVGTKYVTMTLKVPTSVVPTISKVTLAETTSGLAAQFGAFIQGKSKVKATITAAGAKGSTIKSYSSTLQGSTYTGSSWTTGLLTSSGSLSLVTTVTDSRGRTAKKTTTVTVLPYSLPSTSEFKAFRTEAGGSPAEEGTYLSVAFAYSVASCGGKNTASRVIEYKRSTASSWTTLQTGSDLEGSGIIFFADGPTFSTDYQFDVRMRVTDWFGASTSYTVVLPTADVVLDISADGTGLGLGKVSQKNDAIELGRQVFDQFGTLAGNGLAMYSGSGSNGIDANTTLEHLVLTDKNTPSTGFWYVHTLFYSTKSVNSNRTQYALPYNADGSLWVRRYYNSAWSAWIEAPAVAAAGTSGIWTYTKWIDGRVELSGTYNVSNIACTTALGNWFRTAVFTPNAFPFSVTNPIVMANYESAGYGALLWATTEATTTSPPSYYLIRPTSTTISTGKVRMRVTGRWK